MGFKSVVMLLSLVVIFAAGCQSSTTNLRNVDEVQLGRDKRSPAEESADKKLIESVTAALRADAEWVEGKVDVDVYRRVVTLAGQVANQNVERRMVKSANGIAGVTVVVSRLKPASGN